MAGRPADTSGRHAASRQLDRERDAAVIAQYRDPAFVLGGWMPQMAPIILASPKATAATAGSTVTLAVTVAGIPDVILEWRRDGKLVLDDGRVTGVRTRELTISRFARVDAGRYMVIATNSAGRAESAAAVVTAR